MEEHINNSEEVILGLNNRISELEKELELAHVEYKREITKKETQINELIKLLEA